ncbi:MAG TPA: CHRD domain-containing protein [Solirubrobacterales bacterium]
MVLAAFPAFASARAPRAISAELSGAEVKNSKGGDDDGLAVLQVTSIEAAKGKLCFKASWTRLGAVTGVYLYEAPKGATGRQVAKLLGPTTGAAANACATGIAASTLGKFEADPTAYFAAITTSEYPSGAVRGQLSGSGGGAPAQKSVTSNAVPVGGAAVTKVTAGATIDGSGLTVLLVPGHYPFAKQSVSLKGLVTDPASSSLKLTLKATGPRSGTGELTVTGPNNSKEPDVAVFALSWSVAGSGNIGTLKLTRRPV